MRSMQSSILLAVSIGVVASCSDPSGPEPGSPRMGVLQLVGYSSGLVAERDASLNWTVAPADHVFVPPRPLAAPDTVDAGTPFDVIVTTIGLSGCWSAAAQKVALGANVIELTPTDVHSGAAVCTHILLELPHRSTLRIDTPGWWTLRVRGRRVRQGDDAWEEPVAAERTVVVR